jgi:hypothetical protein
MTNRAVGFPGVAELDEVADRAVGFPGVAELDEVADRAVSAAHNTPPRLACERERAGRNLSRTRGGT